VNLFEQFKYRTKARQRCAQLFGRASSGRHAGARYRRHRACACGVRSTCADRRSWRPVHPTLSFWLPPGVGKMLAFQALRWL